MGAMASKMSRMGWALVGLALFMASCQGASSHSEEVLPDSSLQSPAADSSVVEDMLVEVAAVEEVEETAGGKPCMQRKDEREQLLKAYQAARLIQLDSPQYGVEDDTATQLVHSWETEYKQAQAEYVFYCTQTEEDLATIAAAVHKKEGVAAENAAQAGLIAAQATIKHKREKALKAAERRKERAHKEKIAAALRIKVAQEKTDKLANESINKNTERLQQLPQITRSLYGVVRDGSNGKVLEGATIKSRCLFTKHDTTSRANGKFTVARGVSGPTGRQCKIAVSKKGFVTAEFPLTVTKGPTDGMHVESMLVPEIKDEQQFRYIVQYGANPPNLDAHVLVPMPDNKHLDVGASPLGPSTANLKFGSKGAAEKLPYTTLDHSAMRFGPETISVHNVNDGVYHFMVSNAAQSFTTEQNFHESDARAFLYQGNKLLNTVAIDNAEGEPTQMWDVYALSCESGVCSLSVVNAFVSASPVQ